MADSYRDEHSEEDTQHEGAFDGNGELYEPNPDEEGTDAGSAFGEGTVSGTTGRIQPPGSGHPVDDKQF